MEMLEKRPVVAGRGWGQQGGQVGVFGGEGAILWATPAPVKIQGPCAHGKRVSFTI